MIYYYDLHIHSVLSPCADTLMTPNNIFNMANLKGLNIIAVTDHNSLKQLSVCSEIAESYDILFIPGVEISVSEGFHVLCYFKESEDAHKFDNFLHNHIEKKRYNTESFGKQELTNVFDEIIDEYPYYLSPALPLSLKDIKSELKSYEHLLFYAHIDHRSLSGLDNIDKDRLDGVEVTTRASKEFMKKSVLNSDLVICNSDAHQITDILEKTERNTIFLNELTMEAFFRYFKNG